MFWAFYSIVTISCWLLTQSYAYTGPWSRDSAVIIKRSNVMNGKYQSTLSLSNKAVTTNDSKDPVDAPYLKHQCPSCSYIYDEEKGFKKRYPPGTRLASLQVFMCPVCGAAKDQFKVLDEEPPSN